MNKKLVKKFNIQQRNAMLKICAALEGVNADNITRYVGFYPKYPKGKDSLHVVTSEVKHSKKKRRESHDYLNYYWCEYKKGKNQYRITMFYKDFDCGSGNIHVLPGAIQVWKKANCESCEKVFCEATLSQCKRKRTGEISYKMVGGKPYCEYGWKPLLGDVMYWDDDILNEFINNIAEEDFQPSRKIFSSKFYSAEIKKYSSEGRPGHYMRYSLLRFKGNTLYYKTILKKGYGYFTKYDGEEVMFSEGRKANGCVPNECGPNYYDEDKEKWIIKERLYDEKKATIVS